MQPTTSDETPLFFGVRGTSNAGKTRLVEQLVAALTAAGIRIGTVKHASHRPTLDKPGKDSYRHAAAGARRVALIAPNVAAAYIHVDAPQELAGWTPFFAGAVDVVVVEGYKRTAIPHVEVVLDPDVSDYDLAAKPGANDPAWRLRRPNPAADTSSYPDPIVAALAAAVIELLGR